ncbi:decaprenyl-phosphate phosphoribosyltransferase [Candidatus Woesearchaeota archaeon CG10_big_fil_rev_8_21_14_0_10_37_12]|nr:MAG: decaprenyl-phosphate phosphoribosyltransferase [Candidatus Woesearchaeota archaeon CG10_big_fil_rev_8_21_14_0_10_37_12]
MQTLLLLRPQQWYKNFLVFVPLIFSGNLTNNPALIAALLAFVSFCCFSSATYIINDYVDREKDRQNPEKKNRPLAAKTVGAGTAFVLIIALLIVGFFIANNISKNVVLAGIAYILLSQAYTFWLKHEVYADIILLSVNYVIRAMAGAYAINVFISPWLMVCVFFLALFLVVGKRHAEVNLLKHKADKLRKTLAGYSEDIVTSICTLATTTLILAYTLYVFFGIHHRLYITLPFAIYLILRYYGFVRTGHTIARHPHYIFLDSRMVIGLLLWLGITLLILY